MQIADLYRELRVPKDRNPWASSGRNEAANTVVVQLERTDLRDPTTDERRRGIAKVHELPERDTSWMTPHQQLGRAYMRADLAFANDHGSCVRAIVDSGTDCGILPQLGAVVDFDERTGACKIVFFNEE
jgi:hypothetical protein